MINQKYKIAYYEPGIDDMVVCEVIGRERVLNFAKDKRFVSITIS